MSQQRPRHDPAARSRITWAILAVVLLWPMLEWSEFRPGVLLDTQNLHTMGGFLSSFLPPAHDADFLRALGLATLETLAMATAGLTLAVLISIPAAILAAQSLSISAIGPARRRWPGQWGRAGIRVSLATLRGIPELVWALVFVRVFGLGPAAGVVALAITYGGMLGKVYAEILESSDTRPAKALLAAGSSRLGALTYGLLPNAAQELVSYTVYRWECAVRASVIMGFVGAGGLGQLMDQSMKMLAGGEAASILIVFLLLVTSADALSAWLRRQLA